MAYIGFVGSGSVGNFSSTVDLQAKFPAELFAGRMATIENGDGTVSQYFSDGSVWDIRVASTEVAAISALVPPASGHAQRLLNKMRFQSDDATLLVVGDSTGNSTTEWVYLLGQWLGQQFPTFTVNYRLWDTTDYAAATTVQTGTGAKTLTIYNASVAGTRMDYFLGERYAAGVKNLPSIDLLIVNHGHNITGHTRQDTVAMQWLELTEPLLIDHPDAGIIVVAQNPELETTDNDMKAAAARDVCAMRGFGLADVWKLFTDQGKAASLYVTTDTPGDTKHPSDTGTQLFMQAITAHFNGAATSPAQSISLLSQAFGPNLLANGSFADYPVTPGAPTGWTAANVTATKDTSFKFGPNQYSVKLVGTGGGQPYIQQDLTANQLAEYKDKWLILAVATYVDSGQDTNAARPANLSTAYNTNNYVSTTEGKTGWRWKFLPKPPDSTTTYLRTRLYANTGAASTGTAYIGAAILRVGKVPSAANA